MEKWTALLPDRSTAHVGNGHVHVPLIGRLPAEAYLSILQYLPVPDHPQFARCCRRFASLVRDDRVWSVKLRWLDYRGPGQISWIARKDAPPSSATESSSPRASRDDQGRPIASKHQKKPPDKAAPLVDDEFGDFFEGGDVSLVHDDGFGQFETAIVSNNGKASLNSDPFGLDDDLGRVSLSDSAATSQNHQVKKPDDDLMLIFDDETSAKILPQKAAQPQKAPPTTTTTKPRTSIDTSQSLRSVFQTHQSLLLPYYLSFVTHSTSSLLFSTGSLTPETRALILSSLVRFCQAEVAPTRSLPQRQTVLRNVQSATDFFESALIAEFEQADNRGDETTMRQKAAILYELKSVNVIQIFVQKREIFYDQSHNPLRNLTKNEDPSGRLVDGIDFTAMDAYMTHVLRVVEREGSLIARVFPPEADVLLYFTERIANDVISDYIMNLLSAAQSLQQPLFLLATAATFAQCYRLVDKVLEIEPKSPLVTKARAEDIIFRMFEPHMDDYLQEEGEWIRQALEKICEEFDSQVNSEMATTDPTFLTSSNPDQIKKNVVAGFTKALLLPVTIIPKTASYGLNAITYGATGAFNTFANLASTKSRPRVSDGASTPATRNAQDAPAQVEAALGQELAKPVLPVDLANERRDSSPSVKSNKPASALDRMQLLLSLDVSLQLVQADRDCLKRIQTFVRYPGQYGQKVRDAIEEVFIILLQTLGEKHIAPAFQKAIKGMERYRAADNDGHAVAPLVQFFELVHIGDTIQQMVEVYFDKEMAMYIDKKDFLNTVVREKKRFEMTLDDCVAQGLNAGVNVLMDYVEHVIFTHQDPRDFCPPEGAEIDLQPTKACKEAIAILEEHCGMLRGSIDKQILEVFQQEVGIRLHGIVLKHMKNLIISIEGGFHLISDLNAYHAFVTSLRQPQVTAYFASLKLVGEIFIVDSPKELGAIVRDVSRYEGMLTSEDMYEIVQRRADWVVMKSQVDKQLFGLKLAEDCTVM